MSYAFDFITHDTRDFAVAIHTAIVELRTNLITGAPCYQARTKSVCTHYFNTAEEAAAYAAEFNGGRDYRKTRDQEFCAAQLEADRLNISLRERAKIERDYLTGAA